MSCPDWRALVRRHEEAPGDSPEWRSALHHLDDCPACQSAAPAADPMLLFRRLPAPEASRDEIETMKQAVASMRRGQTVEHRRRRLPSSWARAAALAAVLLGSLLLRGAAVPGTATAPNGTEPSAGAPPAGAPSALAADDVDLRRLPLIETSDPTYGSIIQVMDDDISVVLVVPGGVDV